MKDIDDEVGRDWAEFYALYKSLPWYDRLNLRFRLAWKAKACPVYLTRPMMRISVLYIAALLVLTNGIGQAVSVMEYVTQIGGALSFALIGSEIARLYGSLPPIVHPVVALLGSALLGGMWGFIPALFKHFIGVNEIIATLILNPIAAVLTGLFWLPRVDLTARLLPLMPSTKLSAGLFLAIAVALAIYLLLWRTTPGLEIRASANAPRFALYGGMPRHKPVLLTMAISGALAGLAGGVEVLGVHYHFVSSFSAVNDFDGLVIAFAGHLHPAGVILFAFLLGGLRTGSLVGLQIHSGIPRELGSALIAMMLIFVATNRFYNLNDEGSGDQPQIEKVPS